MLSTERPWTLHHQPCGRAPSYSECSRSRVAPANVFTIRGLSRRTCRRGPLNAQAVPHAQLQLCAHPPVTACNLTVDSVTSAFNGYTSLCTPGLHMPAGRPAMRVAGESHFAPQPQQAAQRARLRHSQQRRPRSPVHGKRWSLSAPAGQALARPSISLSKVCGLQLGAAHASGGGAYVERGADCMQQCAAALK